MRKILEQAQSPRMKLTGKIIDLETRQMAKGVVSDFSSQLLSLIRLFVPIHEYLLLDSDLVSRWASTYFAHEPLRPLGSAPFLLRLDCRRCNVLNVAGGCRRPRGSRHFDGAIGQ